MPRQVSLLVSRLIPRPVSSPARLAQSASNSGPYTVTVTASDGRGGTVSTTFTLGVTNRPIVVAADTSTGDEQTAQAGTVLANDSDTAPDNDKLTVTGVTGGTIGAPISLTYGTLTLNADGSWLFQPNATANALSQGATRQEQVTYTVTDGTDVKMTTLTITINGLNDAPILIDPATNLPATDPNGVIPAKSAVDGGTITIPTAQVFTDPNSADPRTYTLSGNPAWLTIDPATGIITTVGTIPGDASQNGPYQLTVSVSDGQGGTVATTFSVNITNPPPVAVNDTSAAGENTTQTGTLLANDSDGEAGTVNDDPLRVTAINGQASNVGQPIALTYGDLIVRADGTWTFTPNAAADALPAGATRVETVSYLISDGQGGTATSDPRHHDQRPERRAHRHRPADPAAMDRRRQYFARPIGHGRRHAQLPNGARVRR